MIQRSKLLLALVIAFFVAATACVKSRDRLNPLDPQTSAAAPQPTPGPQVLWKNGIAGAMLGKSVTAFTITPCSVSNVVVTDNVTGDTTTLRVATTSLSNTAYVFVGAANTGPYPVMAPFQNGHISFDMRIELPASSFTEIFLGSPKYSLTPGSFNTSTFTHVVLPVTAKRPVGDTDSDTTYFELIFGLTSNVNGAIATLNDVRYTAN
jgi:hypothetical protein